MPAGNDFTCINPSCLHYGASLSMHDFWPLARIEDIIASDRALSGEFEEGYLEGITELKKQGRPYVCAPFPKQEDVHPCGIRVQLYCDNPPMMVDQDIICHVPEDGKVTVEAIENEIIRDCGECRSTLMTFREALAKGINCPHCGERLDARGWHTKS